MLNQAWADAWNRHGGTVYVLRAVGTNRYKVGFTSKGVKERVKQLQTGCPFPIEVVCTTPGDAALEGEVHELLSDFRAHGEWFELTVADFMGLVFEAVGGGLDLPEVSEVESLLGWMDRQELADALGVSIRTLYRRIDDGDVLVRSGPNGVKQYRLDEDKFSHWLEDAAE